ncbi:twin-arginine translocase TatA/TatE family subunit [Paenibacillus mendelii]|uniref:Sec-independent protein translocase protein TatA n=1 Tax=Paenibacillus mendelii TaxID=206163 RepID=A0ABV6JF87_9BACL|nr:twin-arginine translocase TatA/TatE family subunit [Paenibacillus mendelii]MCQ6557453.1 twin-arginine translocase TatA/TatE family subunit [Paenibacillus mendelii]
MPYGIGVTGLLLILVAGLLLFGPSKLPKLGRAIGSTLSEFRRGTREFMNVEEERKKEAEEKT